MYEIIDDNIDDLSGNSLFLLFFTAKWCGPCKRIKPMIQKLSEGLDSSQIIFCKVDIDRNDELPSKLAIESVPSFVLMKDNKLENELDRCSGSDITKIHQLLKQHL